MGNHANPSKLLLLIMAQAEAYLPRCASAKLWPAQKERPP